MNVCPSSSKGGSQPMSKAPLATSRLAEPVNEALIAARQLRPPFSRNQLPDREEQYEHRHDCDGKPVMPAHVAIVGGTGRPSLGGQRNGGFGRCFYGQLSSSLRFGVGY